MKETLLSYLHSPCCKMELELKIQSREDHEIKEGQLVCRGCARSFPIWKGVPRFLDSDSYTSSFSFEWQIHQRTQFDSRSGGASSADFGVRIDPPAESLEGKLVLDAGCGTGRHMDVLKDSGAEVIGVDYSYAIDVAYANLSGRQNMHFLQGDILNLPLRDGLFSYVYSIGVLHHTPDTRKAFEALLKTMAPGGHISIYVYPSYDWLHRRISGFYRRFTTRIPKRLLYNLCKVAIPLHYVEKIPLLGPITKIIFPTAACYNDPKWRVLNTFDWYSPKYQWAHTIEEVFGWFEEAGLQRIRVLPTRVSLAGVKPLAAKDQHPPQ